MKEYLSPVSIKFIGSGAVFDLNGYFSKDVGANELPEIFKRLLSFLSQDESVAAINQKLPAIKKIIHGLLIDVSNPGAITIVLLLNGETKEDRITFLYTKSKSNGNSRIIIESVQSTKTWIGLVLENFVLDFILSGTNKREFELPELAIALLP